MATLSWPQEPAVSLATAASQSVRATSAWIGLIKKKKGREHVRSEHGVVPRHRWKTPAEAVVLTY